MTSPMRGTALSPIFGPEGFEIIGFAPGFVLVNLGQSLAYENHATGVVKERLTWGDASPDARSIRLLATHLRADASQPRPAGPTRSRPPCRCWTNKLSVRACFR